MTAVSSIDWNNGSWSHPTAGQAEATLCIAGDWAPIRAFTPLIESGPKEIYGDLLEVMRRSDLSIVNLEAPLSDSQQPIFKSGTVFKGMKKHIRGLAAVPVDVVTLAANHMFDYGLKGYRDTLEVLEAHHIKHLGAGENGRSAGQPLVVEVQGITVGIVNFSEGEDLKAAGKGPGVMGWEMDRLADTVRDLKDRVDFVLVIGHCGIEYIPFPPPYVVRAFERLARAGADCIIGHHPHVPQGITFHGKTPICYSLGNFVFYQETRLKFRKLGYLVNIGITKKGLVSVELVPYKIHSRGLSALSGIDRDYFFKKLEEISAPLHDPRLLQDTWDGFLDHYGTEGFEKEMAMIMETLQSDPGKGAAMFRNRITTPQHFQHWKDFMTRVIEGRLGTAPQWALDLTREYLTAELDPHTWEVSIDDRR